MFSYRKIVFFASLIFFSFGFVYNSYQNEFLLNSISQQLNTTQTDTLRKAKNEAFKRGEKLKYRMHYGFINAGEALLQVVDETKQIGGRNTLHVLGLGATNS